MTYDLEEGLCWYVLPWSYQHLVSSEDEGGFWYVSLPAISVYHSEWSVEEKEFTEETETDRASQRDNQDCGLDGTQWKREESVRLCVGWMAGRGGEDT